MKKCVIVPFLALFMLMGCVQLPSVIVGDSSGILTYDRNTRRLEVLWEKHLEVKDSIRHLNNIDSVRDNSR